MEVIDKNGIFMIMKLLSNIVVFALIVCGVVYFAPALMFVAYFLYRLIWDIILAVYEPFLWIAGIVVLWLLIYRIYIKDGGIF
ncbi:MAG: hypothetical protein Q4G16_06810 [Cruoricaptor ignavus]|nr:hypothetical protein [Cruoricaptor ignavus]